MQVQAAVETTPAYSIFGQPAAHVHMATEGTLTFRTPLRLGPGRIVPFRVMGRGLTNATVLSAQLCGIRTEGPLYELRVALRDPSLASQLGEPSLEVAALKDEHWVATAAGQVAEMIGSTPKAASLEASAGSSSNRW
jgi:hypothetical protein